MYLLVDVHERVKMENLNWILMAELLFALHATYLVILILNCSLGNMVPQKLRKKVSRGAPVKSTLSPHCAAALNMHVYTKVGLEYYGRKP